MSTKLTKLIDLSLVPASLVIISKFVGVYGFILIFDIEASFADVGSSLFNLGPVVSANDAIIIATFSDLLMFATIVTFFIVTLVRAVFLHSSHVKPTLISKLASKNLLWLVRGSYEIYHEAVVGITFLWLVTSLLFLNSLFGFTLLWVPLLAFFLSILLTASLIYDIYREIENIKHHPGSYNWA